MKQYQQFLQEKQIIIPASGFEVDEDRLNKGLFDFQKAIVRWSLARGKAAIFADCGLGKTAIQLEWANWVNKHTGKPVLILTPLAVAQQTKREGEKFGIDVVVVTEQSEVVNGVNVTNYEKLHHFQKGGWGGIVLDESSILKAFDGKTRKLLTKFSKDIPYRLCCTATPAPNDLVELTNHAEFLDIMTGKEIVALFFTQDGNSTHNWKLKGHARNEFWKWMAQWSVAIRKPSDLGYEDNGFILPSLNMHSITVDGATPEGYLIPVEARTLSERRAARRSSMPDRVQRAAELVNDSNESWLIWCDLNIESVALKKAIPDAIEVTGSDSQEHKIDAMMGFIEGRYRVIVTKPLIAGFGMNFQHCHNMAFVGLSDSYEQQYQAIRRCWRFGQESEVNVYVVTATTEGAVVDNIKRKERQATTMFDNIVKHITLESTLNRKARRMEMDYEYEVAEGYDWKLYLGDSVETIDQIDNESVGFTIFSPPFPGMYAYTNSVRDMGNAKDIHELVDHFRYLAGKILEKTMPGRLCAIHLTQEPVFKGKDGYVGRRDFRGKIIDLMQDEGWIYWSEVTIDKNPQVKAARTKEHTLLFKTLSQDSSNSAPALADYLLVFKKHGDNPIPVMSGSHDRWNFGNGWITPDEWIRWARPVWYAADYAPDGCENHDGIRESDVLNVRMARETDDERHLCPLQLGVISRAIKLWSAPGDTVYSPFAGIGSEGYEALQIGRKFVGGELKRSYWESAQKNLKQAIHMKQAPSLFDFMAMKENEPV